MARPRTVVQVERLRDQVYRLIRDDLKAGELGPGQRIIEGELAERYRVSRTPVREALFQLSRDGLIMSAPDRGYSVVIDTPTATEHRHEVRDLVDPQVARHAAIAGTAEQKKAFAKAHERQKSCMEPGQEAAFFEANANFRERLRAMCDNALLVQCSALVDDQAQWARRAAFSRPEYRALEVDYDGRLLDAVLAGDGPGAEAAMHAYVATVRRHLVDMPPDPPSLDK
ncbi:MAG TPA: GntR family transcriptional regulator [Caulobacteraceae bacterium]|jgi:DNA-binding GntR family transcriptional regulator|nr:GntR family transcriptional regulator [Caulobacteraceae bacterium]